MLEAIVFYTLAAFMLGFGVLVITARNTVHSVLFLVANFLCVAVMYVALAAEFLAVIQVLVYAGGIVVLYLFVVMLVNLKAIPEAHMDPRRRSRLGFSSPSAILAGSERDSRLRGAARRRHAAASRRRRRHTGDWEYGNRGLAACTPTIWFLSSSPRCCCSSR